MIVTVTLTSFLVHKLELKKLKKS